MRGWVRTRGRNCPRTRFPRRTYQCWRRSPRRTPTAVVEVGALPWEVVLARYRPGRGHRLGGAWLGFLWSDMGCDCFCLSSRRLSGFFVARRSATTGAMGVHTEPGSFFMSQSTVASGRISRFSCSRCSRLEIWSVLSSRSRLRIWQSHVLCLGVACGNWTLNSLGRFCGYSCAMLGSPVDTCSATKLFGRIHTHLCSAPSEKSSEDVTFLGMRQEPTWAEG